MNILDSIENWKVDTDRFSFSDHRYITYSLNFEPLISENYRYKTKNKSFKRFNELIKSNLHTWMRDLLRVNSYIDLDIWIVSFENSIITILNKCCRLRTMSYRPNISWYTLELKILRNKVNAMYKRSTRNADSQEYREAYKIQRNIYKRAVIETKKKSWLNYCERTEEAYGNLYKYISGKYIKQSDTIFTIFEDSTPFDSYDEVAYNLMKTHFNVLDIPSQSHTFITVKDFGNDKDFPRVSNRELKFVIGQQSLNKASGHDNIDALIVKKLF